VGNVAKFCREIDAKLIHFSTDYVFDGMKAEGYSEGDAVAPINVYGESKLAGEKLITESMEKYYIVRTSWLFGKNGKNFVTQ
jgi:dTDP-4-dehydrorhamnose reductase